MLRSIKETLKYYLLPYPVFYAAAVRIQNFIYVFYIKFRLSVLKSSSPAGCVERKRSQAHAVPYGVSRSNATNQYRKAEEHRKKTIYLHLGTFKTATTYLQYVFYHNFSNFRNSTQLFYYPSVGLDGYAHHYLLNPVYPGWKKKRSETEYIDLWKKLLKTIQKHGHDKFLLSSEMLCTLQPGMIEKILKQLGGYEVKAIIYLRRQDQYFSSLAAQMVKGCHGKMEHYMDLEKTLDFISTSHNHDYGNICDKWASFVGRDNLIVRPFERAQWRQGDILADFFYHLTGVELPGNLVLPESNVNPRLCRDGLAYKQLINRLPLDRDAKNVILPDLFEYSNTIDPEANAIFQEHTLLSPKQRMDILQRCEKVNAVIAQKYLSRANGTFFYEFNLNCDDKWGPYPGLAEQKVREITAFLYKRRPELIHQYKKALRFEGKYGKDLDMISRSIDMVIKS